MRQHSPPPGRLGEFVEAFFPAWVLARFKAPAVFAHYRGRFLSVHVEQHINQTLESVDCDGFQYVQESPHERTSFSGPA